MGVNGECTRRPAEQDLAAGRRLSALRRSRGLSRAALGAASGVSGQQIKKYEDGRNRMSVSRAYAVATALGTSVTELTGTSGALPIDQPSRRAEQAAELMLIALRMDDKTLSHFVAVAKAAAR